jgi:hypothetical protein
VKPDGANGEARVADAGSAFLPTALPAAVLVRDGRPRAWTPRSHRTYPAGTLGGDRRTLAAHVFVPLESRAGVATPAREVGVWARHWLKEHGPTGSALVITRAGEWRSRDEAGKPLPGGEPALEVYVQVDGDLTRDAWTRTLRDFADAAGARYRPAPFDIVLVEDGLMYKRAIWDPEREVE